MLSLSQGFLSSPDPFSQSTEQLIQSGPDTHDRTGNLNADFDALGNRGIPLKAAGFVVPVNYQTDMLTRDLATNIGPNSIISYSPILPITGNPYRMRPAVDVLMRIRRFDLDRPTVGYSIQHDTALPTQGLGEPVEAISQRVSTELRIQTARDRPGRFKVIVGVFNQNFFDTAAGLPFDGSCFTDFPPFTPFGAQHRDF